MNLTILLLQKKWQTNTSVTKIALGKTLTAMAESDDYTVTGVVKSMPQNSHIQFDFLIPIELVKGIRKSHK